MPIVNQFGDPSVQSALEFLLGQDQQRKQLNDAAQAEAVRQQQQQQFAAQQANAQQQQAMMSQLAAAAQGAVQQQPPPQGPMGGDPSQPGIPQQGPAQQAYSQHPLARAAAGAAFLDQQNKMVEQFAQNDSQIGAHVLDDQSRQAIAVAQIQSQAANEQAIAQRQQELAEMNSNLQLRNKFLQTAPGILDPDTLAQAQARIQANQQVLTGPAQQARQKLLDAIAQGHPDAIQEGLRQGVLAFSPEQQTRILEIRNAMAQNDMDPRMSPPQRTMADRSLAEKLNAIRPMEVPVEKQPVDPIEQFHKDTITIPDQATGLPMLWARDRNGVPRLLESSKQALAQYYQQKTEDYKLANGMSPDYIMKAKHEAAIETLNGHKPQPKEYISKDDQGENDMDWEAYRSDLRDWRAKHDELANQFYRDAGGRPAANPASVVAPPPDAQQPVAGQPPTVSSPDEITAMLQSGQLNIGDTVNTPAGPRPITQDVYSRLMDISSSD